MFTSTRGVAIGDNATFNLVHRDQYNQTTINNRIVHVRRPGRATVKRGKKKQDDDPEYDQYREIIRGDIHKLEQLSSEDDWEGRWKWEDGRRIQSRRSYHRAIHQARVYGDDRVFTAFTYHGRDALEAWKRDFARYSQAKDPGIPFQLFGINRSKVPTLLFYDEWFPLGYLYQKVEGTFWERFYLGVYAHTWQQSLNPKFPPYYLWLNSRTGHISSGPEGLSFFTEDTQVPYNSEDMPSAIEMLNSNTCVRFFSETGTRNLDLDVLQYASHNCGSMPIEDLIGIETLKCQAPAHLAWEKSTSHDPWLCSICENTACDEVQDFIGKLCLDTVYSGVQPVQIASSKQGLANSWEALDTSEPNVVFNAMQIESGLIRLQYNAKSFTGSTRLISVYTGSALGTAWLSQAHSFSEVSTGDSETFFIPRLEICLRMVSQRKQTGSSALEPLPIAYIFIQPPPPSLEDLSSWMSGQISFWSFDESGTSEIPEFERKNMGLPNIALYSVEIRLRTWSKHVYDAVRTWQVTREFDPATTDLARFLGLVILEPVVKQDARFEELIEDEADLEGANPISDPLVTSNSPPEPDADIAELVHFDSDNPSLSQPSLLPTPLAAFVSWGKIRRTLLKQKRIKVVIIHDTDSESEPEPSHQPSMQKRVEAVTIHDTDSSSESEPSHRQSTMLEQSQVKVITIHDTDSESESEPQSR